MAKNMRTPLAISGFGYFSQTHWWQMYKIEHTAMQSPWTNIGSRIGRTEELSDFQHGTFIGCHLSNKSVHQISALLELPQSTVSAVIVKWKHLGATTAQLWRGRPHKLTERDRRVLKREAWKNHLSSVATLTTEFQTDSVSNVSTSTARWEIHEMGFQGRAATHKPQIIMRNAKCWLEWCKAHRHWTLEQWKHVL